MRVLFLCCLFTIAQAENYSNTIDALPNFFQQSYIFKAQDLIDINLLDDAAQILSNALKDLPSKKEDIFSLGTQLLILGNKYFDAHETEKALQTYKKILTLSVPLSIVHFNIGSILAKQLGAFSESLEPYQASLALQPNSDKTHLAYGISLLGAGHLEQGFIEYEHRATVYKNAQYLFPETNLLTTLDGVEGKRILIRAEKGIGNTFMFVRYAQLLKKLGAVVILETPSSLFPLFSTCPYIDEITLLGSSPSPFDFQISLLSLPRIFKTTLKTIPGELPYLYANPKLISLWKHAFINDTNIKIGVCWQESQTQTDAQCMLLGYFEKLATIPGISLYSLQKDDFLSQSNAAHKARETLIKQPITQLDEDFGSFMDSAAIMHHLDLVITVDTAIAHLAGALGVPTWIVLPFPAQWHWLENGNDSPWYPTVRLFRQERNIDLQVVFNQIDLALQELKAACAPVKSPE